MRLTTRRADRYCEGCRSISVLRRRQCAWCSCLFCVKCLPHQDRYCLTCKPLVQKFTYKKGYKS